MPASGDGDATSVCKAWYHGGITRFDAASGKCTVRYGDCLNLLNQTKFRLAPELIHCHGDVPRIADALRALSDMLPSAGCCSGRPGCWRGWYADVEAAGSVIALVKVAYELACQVRLRGGVATEWWNTKQALFDCRWLVTVRRSKVVGSTLDRDC